MVESNSLFACGEQTDLERTSGQGLSPYKIWSITRSLMPVFEGRVTEKNLSQIAALLTTDAGRSATDYYYNDYMTIADSVYRRTSKVAHSNNGTKTEKVFTEAYDLLGSGFRADATETFKKLAENGNVAGQLEYPFALFYDTGCFADRKLALAYWYSAARIVIDLEMHAHPCGPWFVDTSKVSSPREALRNIASTCYRTEKPGLISAYDAHRFYMAASDIGDLEALSELAWCYETGFGVEKDEEVSHFLEMKYKNCIQDKGKRAKGKAVKQCFDFVASP